MAGTRRATRKTEFRIEMSRTSPGDNWSLRLQDEKSGLMLLEITLTPEQFSKAIGSASTKVDGWVGIDDRYGLQVIYVHDEVKFPDDLEWKERDRWGRAWADLNAPKGMKFSHGSVTNRSSFKVTWSRHDPETEVLA